jgi:imidazolonepropionase
MSVLISNISGLVMAESKDRRRLSGADMKHIPVLANAWLLTEGKGIAAFGEMETCPQRADKSIDASGCFVLPCWCDSHTHLVYAGSREEEFVHRIEGLSYEQIARRGGGILNSAQKLNATSEEELFDDASLRLQEVMTCGTGAVEIKSGYGLSYEGELKMLRVMRRLKETSSITIRSTFLGAHAVPLEYKDDRAGYIDLLTHKLLPVIADEGLADFIDVFCDRGFFTPDETEFILEEGEKRGLRAKIHANELGFSGGVQVGVKLNALSVDHLEHTGEEEIAALRESDTMPTLLPSTAFFLRLVYPPARRMIDAGLPVALASDYNPGSSPSGNMPFVLSLACIKMGMFPEEAIAAATLNGAYAMGVEGILGSVAVGKTANLCITKPIPSLAYLPYSFGSRLIDRVVIGGEVRD